MIALTVVSLIAYFPDVANFVREDIIIFILCSIVAVVILILYPLREIFPAQFNIMYIGVFAICLVRNRVHKFNRLLIVIISLQGYICGHFSIPGFFVQVLGSLVFLSFIVGSIALQSKFNHVYLSIGVILVFGLIYLCAALFDYNNYMIYVPNGVAALYSLFFAIDVDQMTMDNHCMFYCLTKYLFCSCCCGDIEEGCCTVRPRKFLFGTLNVFIDLIIFDIILSIVLTLLSIILWILFLLISLILLIFA